MSNAAEMAGERLERLIDRLHERGRLRVWSLVITIFGDAIAPRGGRVSLATLSEIMQRLRIEPGALRTALSRLAADGWVARERVGRNSFFELDARGRHAFDMATRRIYAEGPPHWTGEWTVAIAPPGSDAKLNEDAAARGFVRIAPGVFLRPETCAGSDISGGLGDMLVLRGHSVEHPEALQALWPCGETAAHYKAFLEAYGPLARDADAVGRLGDLDSIAARTLLVHEWRRIVLRDPGLPAALLPIDWPGEEARAVMRALYGALAPRSERWLDQSGDLPPVGDAARFRRRYE